MSKFSNTLARIARIIAESTQPLINESERFINDFDFDKAFNDVVEKQQALVEQGKKWFEEFNNFIVDIQNKVKTYDFFINYDAERDMEPIIEYGEDGSISVTVKSKDETCSEQVVRKFPIAVDKEHVSQRYDSDAKRLYFTVGIGEPTPKEEASKEEEKHDSQINGNPHRTSNPRSEEENLDRIRKASERIFNAHSPRGSRNEPRRR